MREKIQNQLVIACEGIDLTTVTDIEFYVKQSEFFRLYHPDVVSPSEMVVVIPFADARRLRTGEVKLQFAFIDQNGVPRATDEVTEKVGVLLKEAGYGKI